MAAPSTMTVRSGIQPAPMMQPSLKVPIPIRLFPLPWNIGQVPLLPPLGSYQLFHIRALFDSFLPLPPCNQPLPESVVFPQLPAFCKCFTCFANSLNFGGNISTFPATPLSLNSPVMASSAKRDPRRSSSIANTANIATATTKPQKPKNCQQFRCQQCPKIFSSATGYHVHMRTHDQGCECPVCKKSFSRHWLLQGHMRTHTGEKPFRCPICAKAFADKSNMRAHCQIHSGLKPFVCRRCGKTFALKSYLSKHEESACVKITNACAAPQDRYHDAASSSEDKQM